MNPTGATQNIKDAALRDPVGGAAAGAGAGTGTTTGGDAATTTLPPTNPKKIANLKPEIP